MAVLFAPDNCDSIGFNGETYAVKDGAVNVPDDAVSVLLAHGFTVDASEVTEEKPRRGRPPKVAE